MRSKRRACSLSLAPAVSGKSRLALEVAGSLDEKFNDGVWWVDLAPLGDESFVPQAVGAALGVREQPRQVLTHTLRRFFADREVLLVVDNCEHVIGASARSDRGATTGRSATAHHRHQPRAAAERWRTNLSRAATVHSGWSRGQICRTARLSTSRCAFLSSGPAPHCLRSSSRPVIVPLSWKSAGISTGCRSRSSWLRRGSVHCRWNRSPPDFMTAFVCSAPATEPGCPAIRRCEPLSTGATTSSRTRSGGCCVACRSSSTASRSKRPRTSPLATRQTAPVSSTP